MNIAATPAPATPSPAPRPSPAPTPTPARSPMTARRAPGQRSITNIPDHSARAPQGPDEQIPIDDADLGGYSPETAAPAPRGRTRVEQGTGKQREIPIDGVKFPELDANELRGGDKTPARETKPAAEDDESAEIPGEETPAAEAKKSEDFSADLGEPESDEESSDEPEAPAAGEKPAAKGARNYAAFTDPTMEKIARSLPNHLYAEFARLAPQWKAAMDELPKLREAVARTPSFHYEHQDGYILSPEWPQLQSAFQAQQNEVNHWDRQLLAIENGEPWRDLIGYDDKGNPQYAEIPAPKDGRVDVRARLHAQNARMRADHQLIQTQTQASQLVNGYAEKRRMALQAVEEHKRRLFPTIDVAKLEGDDKQAYETAGNFIAQIDPSFAKHPATDFARLMYVTLMRVSRQGIKWKQELEKTKANLKGKSRAQNTAIPSGGGGEGDESDEMIPIEHD